MRREAVLVMQVEVSVSQRRACGLIGMDRGTCRYRRRRVEDRRLRLRLRELVEERRRFGYRRLHVLLVREGWQVNHKRVYRLYVEEKLGLRRKTATPPASRRAHDTAAPAHGAGPGVDHGFHPGRAGQRAAVPPR
jgi:putative transposase